MAAELAGRRSKIVAVCAVPVDDDDEDTEDEDEDEDEEGFMVQCTYFIIAASAMSQSSSDSHNSATLEAIIRIALEGHFPWLNATRLLCTFLLKSALDFRASETKVSNKAPKDADCD